MDELSRYQELVERYRGLVGENEELRQLVDLIKENHELRAGFSTQVPVTSPPPPRAAARRLFEDDSGAPRRHYERYRPTSPVSLFPEPGPGPIQLTGSPGPVPIFYSPQTPPVDRRRRVVQLATGPNASPPGRGCFIPVSFLQEPRFASIVAGDRDLHNKYYYLELTPLKQKPTVETELSGRYFASALTPSPQTPGADLAPVLAASQQSPTGALAPVLVPSQQSPTGALEQSSRYYSAVISPSQLSPTVDLAPVLAPSQQSPTVDLAPFLVPSQQSPTGGVELSGRYFASALTPSPQSPTGGLELPGKYFASVLTSTPQRPTGDLELSGKYFASALTPAQQSPTGGLELSDKYFASALTPVQQSPTGGLELSGKYFASAITPPQQSPTGDLELSGKYFASAHETSERTGSHVSSKVAGFFTPDNIHQDSRFGSITTGAPGYSIKCATPVLIHPQQRALAGSALSPGRGQSLAMSHAPRPSGQAFTTSSPVGAVGQACVASLRDVAQAAASDGIYAPGPTEAVFLQAAAQDLGSFQQFPPAEPAFVPVVGQPGSDPLQNLAGPFPSARPPMYASRPAALLPQAPAGPMAPQTPAPFVLQPPPPGRKARKPEPASAQLPGAAGPAAAAAPLTQIQYPQKPPDVRPEERKAFIHQETPEKAGSKAASKDSKHENMERIVGEIAFQLDRRILSAVFPDRNRLYGFTVSNIPKKVQQGGNDPYCKLDDTQAAAIMERYNTVMNRLKPLGYDPHIHPRLTEHVVNTFGILRERPELSGAEAASYNNVQNLQSVVRETVSPDMRNECLMLLSCLSQLSQDDGKPMFIW